MNEILTKVQVDLDKLQKTLEREGEVLLNKIRKAANKAAHNKNVVAKKKEFEELVDKQIKKLEPAFEKFYKDLKVTANKYGVNLDKIEKQVVETTEKAAKRLNIKTKPKTKAKAATTSSDKASSTAAKKTAKTGAKKKKATSKA